MADVGYVVVKTTNLAGVLRSVYLFVHPTAKAAEIDAALRRDYQPGDYMVCELVPVGQPVPEPEVEYEEWQTACEECGSDTGPGFVNFGCSTEDCPGCDRCDLPCLTCNKEGLVR